MSYQDLISKMDEQFSKTNKTNQSPTWMIKIDQITKASDKSIKLSAKEFADFVPVYDYSFKLTRDLNDNSYFKVPHGALTADDLRFVVPIANLTPKFEDSFINNIMIKEVNLSKMLISSKKWNATDSFIFSDCYIIGMYPAGDNMAVAIRYKKYQRKHNKYNEAGSKSGQEAYGHNFAQGAEVKGSKK